MVDWHVQRLENIGNFGDQCGAVLEELVGPFGARIERMARHREHITALLASKPRRDQSAGTLGCLHHDRTSAQP